MATEVMRETAPQRETKARFSIPSILAIIAAILSFPAGAGLGIVLALTAIVLGVTGFVLALAPGVRGGVTSLISLLAGAAGVIAAVIKLIA